MRCTKPAALLALALAACGEGAEPIVPVAAESSPPGAGLAPQHPVAQNPKFDAVATKLVVDDFALEVVGEELPRPSDRGQGPGRGRGPV